MALRTIGTHPRGRALRRLVLGGCFALLPCILRAQECRDAAARAEREFGLPAGLLGAIAQAESGRRDPATGRVAPWPWTIDVHGADGFLPDRPSAVAAVAALQARGLRSIDVGCFQVNLSYHPSAFATLAEAFDPLANARYAARFLLALRNRTGDWSSAIMDYHSSLPGQGLPYRARVLALWRGGRDPRTISSSPVPEAGAPRFGVRIWVPDGRAAAVVALAGTLAGLPAIVSP